MLQRKKSFQTIECRVLKQSFQYDSFGVTFSSDAGCKVVAFPAF